MTDRKSKSRGGSFEALRKLRDEMASHPKTQSKPEAVPLPRKAAEPEDEASLLHRLYAGVRPLDRSPGRIPRQRVERSEAAARVATKGAEANRAEDEAVMDRLRSLTDGDLRFEVADDGERVEGRRMDVPLETLRRLRRGRYPLDARIDLHGLTLQQARTQLEFFLRTMRARGERCVLVIHGKGEHSPMGQGILRGEIAAWLSQGSSSSSLAAFATAQHEDGGTGAVYVLLRS